MKAPIRFALSLSLAIACCTAAHAQRRRAAASRRPAGATPAATPAPAVGPTAWSISTEPFGEDGEATTLVSLQPMPLGAGTPGARSTMSFGVNYTYEGGRPANFKNVSLNFFSQSPACRFPAESGLALVLDGQPLTLPYRPQTKGTDGVWWVTSEAESEGGPCGESLVAYVSPATLARLAAARSVTGTLGAEKFQFTGNNSGGLRALAARLGLTRLAAPAARRRPGR